MNSLSLGLWHGVATVLAMMAFLGVCWWAYSPRNSKRFEDDANIALKTDVQTDRPLPFSSLATDQHLTDEAAK